MAEINNDIEAPQAFIDRIGGTKAIAAAIGGLLVTVFGYLFSQCLAEQKAVIARTKQDWAELITTMHKFEAVREEFITRYKLLGADATATPPDPNTVEDHRKALIAIIKTTRDVCSETGPASRKFKISWEDLAEKFTLNLRRGPSLGNCYEWSKILQEWDARNARGIIAGAHLPGSAQMASNYIGQFQNQLNSDLEADTQLSQFVDGTVDTIAKKSLFAKCWYCIRNYAGK